MRRGADRRGPFAILDGEVLRFSPIGTAEHAFGVARHHIVPVQFDAAVDVSHFHVAMLMTAYSYNVYRGR